MSLTSNSDTISMISRNVPRKRLDANVAFWFMCTQNEQSLRGAIKKMSQIVEKVHKGGGSSPKSK